jgi:multidrug resistance efflux pump
MPSPARRSASHAGKRAGQREVARLNLARTTVRASVDGTISDQTLRPGNYVAPGKAVMALVDNSSLRIEGYFEETKLPTSGSARSPRCA